jgi:hypothetical protein
MNSLKLTPLTLFLIALGAPLGAVACGAPSAGSPSAASAHETEAERSAKVDKWYRREVEPVAKKSFTLFDGLVTGQIESLTEPKPDCTNNQGILTCGLEADLGKDKDDASASSSVVCTVSTTTSAFGPVLEETVLKGVQLDETPTLQVKPIGEGLAATFIANTTQEQQDSVAMGTAKFAALYAHGYTASCFDSRAGGRKTFDRVVTAFFKSLKLKSTVTVFAFGYVTRTGDRPNGIRYTALAKRPGDAAGYVEQSTGFALDTDGKTWSIKDLLAVTQRDSKGAVEDMQKLFWADGKGPAVLSAKPSEEKRYRLKFEVGDKSTGLESTPTAPLNTELWAAGDLLRVSSGKAKSYRYAYLDLADSDPVFKYVKVTRSEAGVLTESEEGLERGGGQAIAADAEHDELSIDGRGLVTKEVTPELVSELVYSWGELPKPLAAGKATSKRSP